MPFYLNYFELQPGNIKIYEGQYSQGYMKELRRKPS